MKCLLVLLMAITSYGCATYIIPLESFKQQFAGIDSTRLRTVEINVPVIMHGVTTNSYPANPIDTLDCVDGDNKPIRLANSPSIEIRFTTTDDDRVVLYFDTVHLQDSLVVGARSRFLPSLTQTIPLRSIKLIEVQDGKKDFHYVTKKK